MKHTCFITIVISLLFAAFPAGAQHVVLADSMPVSGKIKGNLYHQLKPVGAVQKGLVYQLPVDQMPVLRPDTSMANTMPVHLSGKSLMVVPSRKYPQPNPLIPSNKQGEKFIRTPDGSRQVIIH